MAVKRPVPQLDRKMTFPAASTVVPGDLVVINTSGQVAKAGATDNTYIGIVDYDHAFFAASGTAQFVQYDPVPVVLKDIPFVAIAASPITVADNVKQAASGKIQTASGTVTVSNIGVALTSGTTDAEVKFLPF